MRRKHKGASFPSGDARTTEREAVTLGALFSQQERIAVGAQREIDRIQETINEIAGEVAERAGWPKKAPGGGRYVFNPGIPEDGLVMRFTPPRKPRLAPSPPPSPILGEGEGEEVVPSGGQASMPGVTSEEGDGREGAGT